MKDTLNLELLFAGYRKYVDSVTKDGMRDPEIDLIAHMSFLAGAQAVMSCLETDHTEERFARMHHEVLAMRMDVQKRLEERNTGA